MPERSCFRKPFHSQLFNRSQTLLKSSRQHSYLIISSFWDELISDILGLFVYRGHWLPITSILVIIRRISRNLFLCNFLKKQKPFVKILLYFPNLHKISNISKKKTVRSKNGRSRYIFYMMQKFVDIKTYQKNISSKSLNSYSWDNLIFIFQ